MNKPLTLFFVAVCFCLFAGCKNEEKKASEASSGNAIADYANSLGNAQKSAQKTLTTVGIDQAIKTFYTQEGRLPKDLDELVTKGVINQIPPPPRGMKYDYDAKSGVIKVVPE